MALFIVLVATSLAWLLTRFLILALAFQVVILILAFTQLGERYLSTRSRP